MRSFKSQYTVKVGRGHLADGASMSDRWYLACKVSDSRQIDSRRQHLEPNPKINGLDLVFDRLGKEISYLPARGSGPSCVGTVNLFDSSTFVSSRVLHQTVQST